MDTKEENEYLENAPVKLAAAVITATVTDALKGKSEAIYWLYTQDAVFWSRLADQENTRNLVRLARRCTPGRRVIWSGSANGLLGIVSRG